jgi:hypothetical protein
MKFGSVFFPDLWYRVQFVFSQHIPYYYLGTINDRRSASPERIVMALLSDVGLHRQILPETCA